MSTVTLFVAEDRDRQLLAEWLGEEYEVSTPVEPRVGVGTDLVIVDAASFPQLKDGLREWKTEAEPVFAPVLLVAEQAQSEAFDPSDWETIDGLYIVDDIVSIPIEKAVLYRRIENLLERRDLSGQLASRYRRSERRFERLFDGVPDPVFVLSEDGALTSANEAFRTLTGLDDVPERSVRLADVDALSATTADRIEEQAAAAFADEPLPDQQPTVRLETPDGEVRYASVSAATLDVEGQREAVVVLRDVTERRERERELERIEQRFRQIAEHVSEIIWLTTIDGDLLYASPGYEELTGRSVEDLASDPGEIALEHAHPDDRERLESYIDRIFSDPGQQDVHTIEYRLLTADGQTRWIETDTYPVYGPDGQVTRLVGILEDVTERKRRERRFDAIFNQTFQLTGLLDPDGRVVELNDQAVAYLDLDREAAVGARVWDAASEILDDQRRDRLVEHVERAAAGEFVRYEERVVAADGVATLDVSIKPIRDTFGEVVLLVVEARDISERKERERELARQNERLEEFASIVSHDLRNPLQIIRARLGIARDTGDLDHLEPAEDAVDRMDRLIDDLLDLARHGDLSVDVEPVSIEEVATRAWLSSDEGDATLDVAAPEPIRADPDRVAQLLENLFRNSVEHGSTGSRTQSDDAVEHGGTNVTVRVEQTADGVAVVDDGPGIPAAERDLIFDLGHTTATDGTGFGLAIVKEIVDAHGWSIAVENDPETGGARFEITGVERLE